MYRTQLVGGFNQPRKYELKSVGRMIIPNWMEKKHVKKHQPVKMFKVVEWEFTREIGT